MCLFSVLVFQVMVKQEKDFGRIKLKRGKYWVKKKKRLKDKLK